MSEPKTIDIEPAPSAPPPSQAIAHREAGGAVAQTQGNPLDMEPAAFSAGLDRRKQNRKALMAWIKEALVEGTDFGSIPTKRGPSKPSLWKPGAEKICGMLGVHVKFPTYGNYEAAALSGVTIKNILLRCEIVTAAGAVVAEGVGARSLEQDYGDLNKALKMCSKSAHIDATLRMAGLSEIFTQDLENLPPGALDQHSSAKAQNSGPAPAPSPSRAQAPAAKPVPRPAPSAPKTATAPAAPPSRPPLSQGARIETKPYSKEWKDRFIKRTNRDDVRPYAWLWAVEVAAIMENERLEDGDPDRFPQSMKAEEDTFKLIRAAMAIPLTLENRAKFEAAYATPADGGPPPAEEDQIPGVEMPPKVNVPRDKKTDQPEAEGKEWWRAVTVPFGKDKGVTLDELDPKTCFGWWCNWEPKEYNGRISEVDVKFRAALDAIGEHRNYEKD